MNKFAQWILVVAGCWVLIPVSHASPQEHAAAFREYFKKRFPDVPFAEFKDGFYALDAKRREAWQEFEEFAPAYEDAVEYGRQLFEQPFANGAKYADCFENGGQGIRQNYPYFDARIGKVKTLEMEINECRVKNKEAPLPYKTGDLAAISAYMAFTSRGKKINVVVPDDPRAVEIFERGKRHFYAKRGQLNFSCADCHVYNAGSQVRTEILSPALGQITHFPVWRKKWQGGANGRLAGLGTLHRRYGGCNKNIRAKPFKPQSDEYVALEYYHTYMSNGLELNGPALRP